MRRLFATALLLYSVHVAADQWVFSDQIAVTSVSRGNVFHHLDSSGRKSIAASGGVVAVAWEDNRTGEPQVFVAFKKHEATEFSKELQVSNGHVAYAPSIVPVGNGQFLVGWEQGSAVWIRKVSIAGLDPLFRVDDSESSQITLAAPKPAKVIAAWSRRDGRYSRIMTTVIDTSPETGLHVAKSQSVDPKALAGDQLYPALAATQDGVTVVWEDRRRGHTILLYAHAPAGKPYGQSVLLNEPVQKSKSDGRGSGVTRPVLVSYDGNRVAAAWMDKRGYQKAYSIYAAFSQDSGTTFGANEIVQDAFAEGFAQWHPAVAGNVQGQVVVAWNDDRDGNPSIWYSWKTKKGWSGDHTITAASGNGEQTNPAMVFDDHGMLHLVWIGRKAEGEPSQLFYAYAKYQPDRE